MKPYKNTFASAEQRKTKNLNNWGEGCQQMEAATMKGFWDSMSPFRLAVRRQQQDCPLGPTDCSKADVFLSAVSTFSSGLVCRARAVGFFLSAKTGEELTLLQAIERELRPNDFLLCLPLSPRRSKDETPDLKSNSVTDSSYNTPSLSCSPNSRV